MVGIATEGGLHRPGELVPQIPVPESGVGDAGHVDERLAALEPGQQPVRAVERRRLGGGADLDQPPGVADEHDPEALVPEL